MARGGFILAALLIILATIPVEAATICSFAGPDISPDFLRLSEFSVSGTSKLKVGDTVTVTFKLQNYGQTDVHLASRGAFVASRDPDNLDTCFGSTRSNTVLKIGETVTVEATRILDKAGTWTIWPSYHILTQSQQYKLGPDYWHSCTLQVSQVQKDTDQDGIPDEQDKCPTAQETFNNYRDDDGCPDELPQETPEFCNCVEILMLRANLSYERAKEICSQEKEELIKELAQEAEEISLPEIGIIESVKISKKAGIVDGIEIDPLPIIVDVAGKNVRLEPTLGGLIMEEDGVRAEGDVEIEYEGGKLVSGTSRKEITIAPSEALDGICDEVRRITIEDKGTPQYLVKVTKKGKLFGLIPIQFSSNYQVDATNGASKEKRPWWSFVVRTVPTCCPPQKLIKGICCLDENHNDICDDKEEASVSPATNVAVSLPEPQCGDGQCYITERNTCCQDCGCPANFRCQENGSCIRIPSRPIPQPTPMPDSYIVVTLDRIVVHDDQDPAAEGELQVITLAATSDKAQTMYWPVELWQPVNSGGAVLGSGESYDWERVPIFSLKQSEMGEKLAISFRAIDNDDLPNWLEALLDILSAPASLVGTVVELLADLLPLPPLQAAAYLESQLEEAFNDLVADNEVIGAVTQIYDRAEDWGVRDEPYVLRRGGMTVSYSIHRVSVPKGSSLGIKINKIVVRETGDYFDGEVWFRIRCATGFGEERIDQVVYRFPRSGTFGWGGGNTLEGPPGPTVEISPGVFQATNLPIIEFEGNGPFTFLEISVWDEDEPELGDDHDLLGHFTETILYPEAEASISTYPRGNIDIWLEYTKR